MKTHSVKCSVDYCDNDVGQMKKLGICATCYAAMYYWTRNHKTPADILRYRRRLMKFQARMDQLQPQITTLKRRAQR